MIIVVAVVVLSGQKMLEGEDCSILQTVFSCKELQFVVAEIIAILVVYTKEVMKQVHYRYV